MQRNSVCLIFLACFFCAASAQAAEIKITIPCSSVSRAVIVPMPEGVEVEPSKRWSNECGRNCYYPAYFFTTEDIARSFFKKFNAAKDKSRFVHLGSELVLVMEPDTFDIPAFQAFSDSRYFDSPQQAILHVHTICPGLPVEVMEKNSAAQRP